MAATTALTGEVLSWSIDSRTLASGDVFFAVRGDVHDGHAWVQDVLDRGAAAAVVDRDSGEDPRLIRVDNTVRALQSLASWVRDRWEGTMVCVTGSAGKTSTKDIVATLLESAMPTGRTTGNFNNHIGLPLSILRMPEASRAAVMELGMNHAGEIRELSAIARPQVAVITNVGFAHVENFEDGIEGVALAKRELVDALPADGTAVLNYDDERVRKFAAAHAGQSVMYGLSADADVRATDVKLDEDGVRFRVGNQRYESALSGRHSVRNVLAGIAVARVLGIEEAGLPEAVRSLRPGKMRGERVNRGGMQIINDCYNSNPEALRSMLEVLRDVPAQRHIAVLGEMLELGRWSESLHREAGSFAARCGISVLVGIRGESRALVNGAVDAGLKRDAAYFFEDPVEAGAWLRTVARSGDAILFKGSRGTRVEKALNQFLG